MKNRVLGIAAIVAVLIAGGLYLGFGKADSKLEAELRTAMENAGIQAETLTVSSRKGEVEATNLVWQKELYGLNMTIKAEKAVVHGFNPACLIPSQDGVLPVVVDSVLLSKASGHMEPKDESKSLGFDTYDFSIDELFLEDWRQNIGNMQKFSDDQLWSVEFFREAYRSYVKNGYYKGYTTTMTYSGLPGTMTTSVAEMSLLKPIGTPDGKGPLSFSGQGSGMNSLLGEMGTMTVGVTEIHDMLLPSPEALADIMKISKELGKLTSDERTAMSEELGMAMLAILKKEYREHAPWSKLKAENFNMSMTPDFGGQTVAFDLFENSLLFGDAYTASFDLKGFLLPVQELKDAFAEGIVSGFMGDAPKLNGNFALSLSTATKGDSTINAGYDFIGLGNGQAAVTMRINMDSLAELADSKAVEEKVEFLNLDMNFDDSGLLAMLFADMASDSGMTLQQALDSALVELGKAPGVNTDTKAKDALKTMLQTPGKLHVNLKATNPMPVGMVLMAALFGMQGLELTMDAEPGPKPMADYLPASLERLK